MATFITTRIYYYKNSSGSVLGTNHVVTRQIKAGNVLDDIHVDSQRLLTIKKSHIFVSEHESVYQIGARIYWGLKFCNMFSQTVSFGLLISQQLFRLTAAATAATTAATAARRPGDVCLQSIGLIQ